MLRKFSFGLLMFTMVISSFGAITPSARALSAGDLVKGPNSDAVYYIGADGKKYVFPDAKTYFTWYSNFDTVQTVTVGELDNYNDGGAVTYRPGTKLVTTVDTNKVYAVEPGGMLRWITDEATAKNLWGNNWAQRVNDVIAGYFSSTYNLGSNLGSTFPSGSLIQMTGDATIYYVDGTEIRPFATGDAFEANGLDFANVVTVASLTGYTTGSSITGEEAEISSVNASSNLPTTQGALSVALASDTPASRTIIADSVQPGEILVDFGHWNFTASSAGAVQVNGLEFTRGGVSSDSDLDNVYLYIDDMRVAEGSVSGNSASFNAANGLFSVPAGSTTKVSFRGDVSAAVTGGKTIQFGLASTSMVTSNAASSSGSFPAWGNTMTIAQVTDLGYVTSVTHGYPTGAVTVDPNEDDFEVWRFTINGNSQKLNVKKLVITEVGSISQNDLANFSLYAAGTMVGSAASMNSDYEVVFDLSANPVEIASGGSKEFSLRADILNGSTRTFQFTFQNADDMRIWDTNYGVWVPPYSSSWSIVQPGYDHTINSGTVTVSKATSSRTDDVSLDATNQNFGTWTMTANGEDMKIKNLKFDALTTGDAGLDNAKVMVNGAQMGSTQDISATTTFTFGSSFIIPAGETWNVELVADAKKADGTSYSDGNTVTAQMADGSSNGQGVSSLAVSNVPGSDINANALTFTDAAMNVYKYSGYGDQTLVAGTSAARLGSFVLNAGASSDISLSSITVTLDDNYEYTSITNLKITNLSAGGTQYGSTKANPSSSNVFSQSLTIPASGAIVFDIWGDIVSNAVAGTWQAEVGASGSANSGSTTVTASATAIQTITIGSGSLTVANGAHPDSAILLAGTTNNHVGQFTFQAANEAFTVQKLSLELTDQMATSTAAVRITYPKQDGTTGEWTGVFVATSGTDFATTTADGLAIYVPRDEEAKVNVYMDYTTVASGAHTSAVGLVRLDKDTNFKAVGASGSTSTTVGSGTLSANNMYLWKTKPTFTRVALSNTPATGNALFKFTVTADSAGSVDIKQLGFNITTTTASVSDLKIYNSTTNTALTDTAVDANASGDMKLIIGTAAASGGDDDVLNIDTSAKTYDIRGTVATWGASGSSITITFKEDTAFVDKNIAATIIGSHYNVWSDRSATAHTTATSDWTNGFLLKDMSGSQNYTVS